MVYMCIEKIFSQKRNKLRHFFRFRFVLSKYLTGNMLVLMLRPSSINKAPYHLFVALLSGARLKISKVHVAKISMMRTLQLHKQAFKKLIRKINYQGFISYKFCFQYRLRFKCLCRGVNSEWAISVFYYF